MDISLLRAASVGPFRRQEVALGRTLLPHLQRAAASSRRLQGLMGFAASGPAGQAAFLVDGAGQLQQMNAAADALLLRGTALRLEGGRLTAGDARFAAAVAAAAAIRAPHGSDLWVAGGGGALQLTVLPVREEAGWTLPGPRAVLVVATGEAVGQRWGLTAAEAGFAGHLATGRSLGEIAAATGRSINTVRTHLARVMAKTGTRRQSQLVRLLVDAARAAPPATAPSAGGRARTRPHPGC